MKAALSRTSIGVTILALLAAAGCAGSGPRSESAPASPATFQSHPETLSEQEVYDIARDAYVYLYPLALMDLTRRQMTNLPAGKQPGFGPAGEFAHAREFPPADFRTIVRPNFDTLYSSAWVDLSKEPMILSAPDTKGRYYLLPILDMYTNVFAVPGKRTTGTQAANFAIVPRGWTGQLPAGVERIDAPTSVVWIIGRTQTNGVSDYDAVHQVQDGYKLTPLSQWGKARKPVEFKADPSVDMKVPPPKQIEQMPAAKFFAYGAELMTAYPPHTTDWSMEARMRRIGLAPGVRFDASKLSPEGRAALDRAAADGFKSMMEKLPTLARIYNGWQMNTDTMGVYGNDYLKRAIVALVGLGANQPQDAIYPLCIGDADNQPLMGENRYVLHFEKGQVPPVDAFWSVTMYDAEGYQVPNRLNRFAIGDRDPLKFNPDGSLDLYLQHESPGPDKESNWLPSPASGKLGVTMRLYSPRREALDGTWVPPAVRRVN